MSLKPLKPLPLKTMPMPVPMPLPPTISQLRAIKDEYDVFLLDLWGVIHNGVKPFPHAVDALQQLRSDKKTIYFISNAPRRKFVIAEQLAHFGITDAYYDAIFSSGEETWHELNQGGIHQFGSSCYHIGPPRDHHLLKELPFTPTNDITTADFILNSGLWRDHDAETRYRPILETAATRQLIMICANPDKEVIRGHRKILCAGALAAIYEELGGKVRYHGKPHPSIYRHVLAHASSHHHNLDKQRIMVIGDSLTTDIQGAQSQQLYSVLITSGIHRDDSNNLTKLFDDHHVVPDALMEQLVW